MKGKKITGRCSFTGISTKSSSDEDVIIKSLNPTH